MMVTLRSLFCLIADSFQHWAELTQTVMPLVDNAINKRHLPEINLA